MTSRKNPSAVILSPFAVTLSAAKGLQFALRVNFAKDLQFAGHRENQENADPFVAFGFSG